ncbi:MAG TPA: phosphoribosyltransferase, partial [Trueperaceae bacterium]
AAMALFEDRRDAGRHLAQALTSYGSDAVILALPRGGVPVGYEVAERLGAPLDVFIVRKLGVPGHEELAMGAIASGGVRVLNEDVVGSLGISEAALNRVTERERRELERREELYRDGQPETPVAGRTVILVDDGLATGASMRAAVKALQQKEPARIVVAVPVAAPETCESLREEVDQVICARTPEPFLGVGRWYRFFPQVTDDEVRNLLKRAAADLAPVP